MKSSDVGSLPFPGNEAKLLESVSKFISSDRNDDGEYFRSKVVDGFIDKIRSGINIPYYPQFRDMNEMFLELISGVERIENTYGASEHMQLKNSKLIPEVQAIFEKSKEISDILGHSFELGVCITGPHTLSTHFRVRNARLILRLGELITELVEGNMFSGKHGRMSMISLDEPMFGVLNDPMMDSGCEARESLRKAWERIFHKADSHGVQTCLHLHSAADRLFWDVESLNVVESEMNNSLYQCGSTKNLLEEKDKFLKANVCASNLDEVLAQKLSSSTENTTDSGVKIKENWIQISNGELNPTIFLEDVKTVRRRIVNIVNRFGLDRVLYAGPECGLRGLPTYRSALECLRRIAIAVDGVQRDILNRPSDT